MIDLSILHKVPGNHHRYLDTSLAAQDDRNLLAIYVRPTLHLLDLGLIGPVSIIPDVVQEWLREDVNIVVRCIKVDKLDGVDFAFAPINEVSVVDIEVSDVSWPGRIAAGPLDFRCHSLPGIHVTREVVRIQDAPYALNPIVINLASRTPERQQTI